MLSGISLVKSYGGRRVVDDLSIRVRDGEIVGLLGPNGAGKTTTFYMLVGLVRPESGRVELDDLDISRLPLHRRARKGIAYLPQEASAFRGLTTEENIRAILEYQGISREEEDERTEGLLEYMGLTGLRDSKAGVLSGGERRRVELARALAIEPRFFLLDEPFAGIDPKQVGEIQVQLERLRKRGIGLVVSDHNVRETLDLVDRAYIIHQGRILAEGAAADLVDDPLVREHYLGDRFLYEWRPPDRRGEAPR